MTNGINDDVQVVIPVAPFEAVCKVHHLVYPRAFGCEEPGCPGDNNG